MTSQEFKQLSPADKKRVPFNDLPKRNKFGGFIVIAFIALLIFAMYNGSQKNKSIDTTDLKLTAKFKVESIVKSLLKAPSTAEFPSETQKYYVSADSMIIITGSVDAQNTFGSMIRNSYSVKLKWKDDYRKDENWSVLDAKLE